MTSFAIWINSSICIVFYFHKLSSDTGGGTYWAKNIYLQSTAHLSWKFGAAHGSWTRTISFESWYAPITPALQIALVTGLCCVIIRICTPSYTCAICFLPLYSARYNGKSVSSTASKPDWFISAFADWWHGVGLNRLVLPSESLCPSIRTSVPYLGLRRCTVGPLTLSRNTIYCISFLIIPQYNVFVNQFMKKTQDTF